MFYRLERKLEMFELEKEERQQRLQKRQERKLREQEEYQRKQRVRSVLPCIVLPCIVLGRIYPPGYEIKGTKSKERFTHALYGGVVVQQVIKFKVPNRRNKGLFIHLAMKFRVLSQRKI